jgi:hypothetical protein
MKQHVESLHIAHRIVFLLLEKGNEMNNKININMFYVGLLNAEYYLFKEDNL